MMVLRKLKPVVISLLTGGILVAALFFLCSANSQKALAAPVDLFITPSGSGDCSQGAPCDLPTALSQAVDSDHLYFAQGTYTGLGGAVITLTKSIGLYGGWDGSTTTPIVRDSNAYPTTVDGEDARQGIHISGDITPTIDGFVITRGRGEEGGGIHITGSPIIKNNVITDNHVIDDPGDDYDGKGGGIYISGGENTVITQNRIYNNTGGRGAGIYHFGYKVTYPITITNNEIVGNVASNSGGGIWSSDSPDIIQSNIISGNTTIDTGGGILLWHSPAQVEANYIMYNRGDSGAGISIGYYSTSKLENNVLARNANDGIHVDTSSPEIINNTIVSQILNSGAGINLHSEWGCEPNDCTTGSYINNIIVKYEYGMSSQGIVTPTIDYNDVWGNAIYNYDFYGSVVTGTHNISINPRFINTVKNNFHLLGDSPCIDAGDPAGVPPAPAIDIDGQPRPSRTIVDIGADEFWFSDFLPLLLK
ncbi:MAG: right-handed parallel beta-helix repeat-containing protein [Anaerolineales bacterium]|nr:right-handed parallel beta-helix repeat-containing protein [Anaerolineales bacterium]